MIDWSWVTTTGADLPMVLLSALGIYAALLVFTRLSGLRTFSKMSSFDFAVTIAIGSVVASTILVEEPPLARGVFALAVLYGMQYLISKARLLTAVAERIVDNEPLLLMAGENVISSHLGKARLTEEDLKSKLRMAGVTSPSQVLAVVFETTGDVAVLTRGQQATSWVFEGVRGMEHLSSMLDEPG